MSDFSNLANAFEMAEILENEFEDEKARYLSVKIFDVNTEQEIDVTFEFTAGEGGDLTGAIAEIL